MNNQNNLNLDAHSQHEELQGNAQELPTEQPVAETNAEATCIVGSEVHEKPENDKIDETEINQNSDEKFELMPDLDPDDDDEVTNNDDLELNDVADDVVVDYNKLSKKELIETLRAVLYDKPVETIRFEIDSIKKAYYKSRQTEVALLKQEFVAKGGSPDAFEVPRDDDEDYFKELLNDYKAKKAVYTEQIEKEKQLNLEKKLAIIEKISLLANRDESLAKTWEDFRILQNEWKEIGLVPAAEQQNVLNMFQIQVERFYDYIRIDKELRDLDLKKNLEQKMELCNKAESLLIEKDVVSAYKKLQEYHQIWKETGPVPNDKREEIWERFQTISKQINKQHQDYFLQIKDELENNLAQKEALCEQAELLLEKPCDTLKEWEETTESFSNLQKMWKSIGMVPRKNNAVVYERFKMACNRFFESKKAFFALIREEEHNNLQKKTELCVLAESLQDSTEWKKTTADFLDLQKKWKTIGPVSNKYSQDIWMRFRKACDTFFNAKQTYFANIENEYEANLAAKKQLLDEINSFSGSPDNNENLNKLKEFQNRWVEIGQVAFKEKDKLQKDYRSAVNALYEKLNIKKQDIDISGYKQKMQMLAEMNDRDTLRRERSFVMQKIKTLDADITLWENNMSFFSGKAESLLIDVKRKIEKAKAEIELLTEQKKVIDLTERDMNAKNAKKD